MSRAARRGRTTAAQPEIWALWRTLSRELSTRRLLQMIFRSGTGFGLYGVDRVSSLRASPVTASVRRVLADADGVTLDRLARIAEVNATRNDALWRAAVMLYISVPGAVLFASLDAAPEFLRELLAINVPLLVGMFLLFTLQMFWYLGVHWRARQLVALIDLVRIEREGEAG